MKPLPYRLVGALGLAAVALILGSVIASSGGEPGFDGAPSAVLEFFRAAPEAATLARFGVVVGLVVFAWFAARVAVLLARAERPKPWRSVVAAGSALVFVTLALNGSWQAVTHRATTISDEMATYAFDVGNLQFANGWVALGSFALCSGWIIAATGAFPRWLGWLGIAAGIGLVASRAVWTSSLWLLPYLAFWIWMIAISAICLGRAATWTRSPSGMRTDAKVRA